MSDYDEEDGCSVFEDNEDWASEEEQEYLPLFPDGVIEEGKWKGLFNG